MIKVILKHVGGFALGGALVGVGISYIDFFVRPHFDAHYPVFRDINFEGAVMFILIEVIIVSIVYALGLVASEFFPKDNSLKNHAWKTSLFFGLVYFPITYLINLPLEFDWIYFISPIIFVLLLHHISISIKRDNQAESRQFFKVVHYNRAQLVAFYGTITVILILIYGGLMLLDNLL